MRRDSIHFDLPKPSVGGLSKRKPKLDAGMKPLLRRGWGGHKICEYLLIKFFFFVFLFSSLQLRAGNNLMYDKANQLYHNKQYTEAIDLYNQLLQDGYQHDALYYNLGNAYYRSNQFGLAIWGYKKAIQISNRRNYRDNLTIAERKTGVAKSNQGVIFFIRWWQIWRAYLSPNTWAVMSILFFVFSFVVMTYKRWKAFEKRLSIGILACLVLSLICLLFSLSSVFHKKKAIIIGSLVMFTTTDHKRSGKLTEGLEVVLGKRVGMKCMIELPDGHEGWVDAKSIRSL